MVDGFGRKLVLRVNQSGLAKEVLCLSVRIEPLKARHDVTKLDLTIPFLFF